MLNAETQSDFNDLWIIWTDGSLVSAHHCQCLSDPNSTSKPLLLSKYPKRRPTMNYALKLSKQLCFWRKLPNAVTQCRWSCFDADSPAHLCYLQLWRHGLVSAVGTSIFVISLFLMFLSSTIYHSMSYGSTHKYILQLLTLYDLHHSRAAIRLLSFHSWMTGAAIWLSRFSGHDHLWYSLQNLCQEGRRKFSLALYLIMGWLVIFIIRKLSDKLDQCFGDSC